MRKILALYLRLQSVQYNATVIQRLLVIIWSTKTKFRDGKKSLSEYSTWPADDNVLFLRWKRPYRNEWWNHLGVMILNHYYWTIVSNCSITNKMDGSNYDLNFEIARKMLCAEQKNCTITIWIKKKKIAI